MVAHSLPGCGRQKTLEMSMPNDIHSGLSREACLHSMSDHVLKGNGADTHGCRHKFISDIFADRLRCVSRYVLVGKWCRLQPCNRISQHGEKRISVHCVSGRQLAEEAPRNALQQTLAWGPCGHLSRSPCHGSCSAPASPVQTLSACHPDLVSVHLQLAAVRIGQEYPVELGCEAWPQVNRTSPILSPW